MDFEGGFMKEKNEIEDLPAAMEGEVYVNGQLHVNNTHKKKKNKKSKRKEDEDYCGQLCGLFRVLWATRQTEDIDKEKNPDRYVKITLRELGIYIVFLIVLMTISFGMVSSTVYTFSGVLNNAFISSKTKTDPYMAFGDISQMNDIWSYLEDTFMDNFFQDGSDLGLNTTNYINTENRVLGVARLRQLRVMSNSCVIPDDFKQEIKTCYADWAPSTEDTMPYGPYVFANLTNDSAWYYQSEETLKGRGHQGLMNYYGGGGYVAILSKDQSLTNSTIVNNLKQNLWIDRATRAVFLDFTVYNANINLFCQVRLVFEMPATGGVVPTFVLRPVKLIRYVSAFDYFIMVCEITFAAFILYYIIEEAIEIRKHKLEYFKALWNILDVVILCIAIVCIVFNIYRQVAVGNLLEQLLADDNTFVDFDFLCYWQTQFNSAIAGMVFLAWIKIFKYISFNKTLTQLSMTLSRCAKDVTGFAIMFFIVFLAYAQLGYLVFGTQVHDFSTFSYSIYTLFRIILGDFDFESLEAANRVLGPIFFLTYVFFVFFVLLNMFIAIINDTYGEIKSELSSQKSDIELASFFKKGYNKVMDKLDIRRAQIVAIHKAITTADLNKDSKIDFVEWRNNLRSKGYSDPEIEALFAKYDVDGDRVLNEEEQKNMLKDLADQNDELKQAYKVLEQAKANEAAQAVDRKKKRTDGVLFEDYTLLSNRIDKMETSIGSILNKVDSVLAKLESVEKSKRSQSQLSGIRIDSARPSSGVNPNYGNGQSYA